MKNKGICMALTGLLIFTTVSCNTKGLGSDVFYMGTTMDIKEAVYGEYNYDMLASGISEMPVLSKNVTGDYEGLLADVKTEDFKTYTYTIKDGMKWSDGVDVTASDFLFSLEYEDDTQGGHNLKDTITDGVTTERKYSSYSISEDDKSITLTLTSKNIREMANMASFRLAPSHLLKDNENPTDEDLRVTSGPYKLTSFDEASGTLKYEKNEYYPYDVNFSKVYVRIYETEDSMYSALTSGTIYMAWNYSKGVDETYYQALKNNSSVSLLSVESENVPASLTFNNSKGIFQDKNLRLAVSYLLDYEKFRELFASDMGKIPSSGFVPESTFGYKEERENIKDVTLAESYLNASGYFKDEDGYYKKDGNALSFTLTINSSKSSHLRYGELVKTCLEEEGILVTLEELDSLAYNAKTSNKYSENNVTMEASIYGYTATGMSMGAGLGSIYLDASHSVQGGGQVRESEFTLILQALNDSKTTEEYKIHAGELQDYYSNNVPWCALYWDSLTYACIKKLKNIEMDFNFGCNNMKNWSTMNF